MQADDRIKHKQYGTGTVLRVFPQSALCRFDSGGEIYVKLEALEPLKGKAKAGEPNLEEMSHRELYDRAKALGATVKWTDSNAKIIAAIKEKEV